MAQRPDNGRAQCSGSAGWWTPGTLSTAKCPPPQLRNDPTFLRPIEEEEFFDNLKREIPCGAEDTEASRFPSIWGVILPLTQYHTQVMQLNHDLVHDPAMGFRVRHSIQKLSIYEAQPLVLGSPEPHVADVLQPREI